MYPDTVMKDLAQWDAQGAVYILDILSACILTALTIALIVSAACIGNKYQVMKINLSWHYAPRLHMKKGIGQRLSGFKIKTRHTLIKHLGWLSGLNLMTYDAKAIIIGSVVIIPLLLLLNSEILAMVIASLFAGLIAYTLHCRVRQKIVLTSVVIMIISVVFICLKINYFMFIREKPLIDSLGLGMGAIGIYLLVLAFLLIPLAFLSWYVTHKLRNVKEQKDPLLVLEGRCDL